MKGALNMSDRDIEKLLRSAFEKSVPDVFDSVSEQCAGQEGRVITMTAKKHRLPKAVKIAAIAAALIITLAVTVTAVGFTGLMSENEALAFACNYVFNTASEDQQDDLGKLILAGMVTKDSAVMDEANIGLENGRPVYRLTFSILDTVYNCTLDAKTGVIYECTSEAAEKVEEPNERPRTTIDNVSEAEKKAVYDRLWAANEAKDYFGIYDDYSGKYYMGLESNENGYYGLLYIGRGYIYSCKVDMMTGEVYDAEVTEDEEYTGPADEIKKSEPLGYIGRNEAVKIACEAAGFEYSTAYNESKRGPFVAYVEANMYGITPYDEPTFEVQLYYDNGETTDKDVEVYIDVETGEVLDIFRAEHFLNGDENEIWRRGNLHNALVREAEDYYGIYPGLNGLNEITMGVKYNLDGSAEVYLRTMGSIYHATIDPDTFEILAHSVEEDEKYVGEKEVFEPIEGFIGQNEAIKIALEKADIDDIYSINIIDGFSYVDGDPVFRVTFMNRERPNEMPQFQALFDVKTSELLKYGTVGPDPAFSGSVNQIPSNTAPKGMISEAAALTAVLDEWQITESSVKSLKITIEGDVYVISFTVSSAPSETVYEVDAKTGKIKSRSGVVQSDMIGEEEALEAVLYEYGLEKDELSDCTCSFVSDGRRTGYEISFILDGKLYRFTINAFDGTFLERNGYLPEANHTSLSDEEALKITLDHFGLEEYESVEITVGDMDVEENTVFCVIVEVKGKDGLNYACGINPDTKEIVISAAE